MKVLYWAVGRKIRESRERSEDKLSQATLADRLGLSRASVVNIEAGRQHAPLHILWQIAEVLGVELVTLIPHRDELVLTSSRELNDEFRKLIESSANGDPDREKNLVGLVARLQTTLDSSAMSDKP